METDNSVVLIGLSCACTWRAFQQCWQAFLDFMTLSENLLWSFDRVWQPDSWLCTHLPQYSLCVALDSSENVHIALDRLRKCAHSTWQVQKVWAHMHIMLFQNCKLWSLTNSLEHIISWDLHVRSTPVSLTLFADSLSLWIFFYI